MEGGVSADVFRVDLVEPAGGERSVVLRSHRDPAFKGARPEVLAREFAVLTLLHASGLAVPEPLALYAGSEADGAWLVMEWVEGSTEVAAVDVPAALHQMADFLAELHRLDVDPASLALGVLEDPLAGVSAHLPDDGTGWAVRRALDSLDDAPVDSRDTQRVVHGDYWPGNVIWSDGQIAGVIDWEDSCIGDPLADLASARVELACAYGVEAAEQFTRDYLAARDMRSMTALDLVTLPIWELYVSASALASMQGWGLTPAAEARRRKQTRAMFDDAAEAVIRLAELRG